MMHMSRAARLWMSTLALCLLIPTLGIGLQNRATLEQFHKRRLKEWPAPATFASDPVLYFRQAKGWVSDRAFPIVQATRLEKTLLYRALGASPAPRITLGKAGHVFVNGTGNKSLNTIFESTCVRAHQPPGLKSLKKSLAGWAKVGRRRRLHVDTIMVPTAGTLYADALPDSIPARYREACLARNAGNSPMLKLRPPEGVGFVYPLLEMLAAREDEAFFPRGNWHPTGLSVKVARDTYLARQGFAIPAGETLERGEAPAELLFDYGIVEAEPTYVLHNPQVSLLPERDAVLRRSIGDLFEGDEFETHVFTNSRPSVDEAALMLTDSFGNLAASVFAGAFRQVIQINTNDLRARCAVKLLDRLQQFEHVDRLILLVHEGNINRISRLLN
jgi:hypothetical protein